MIRKLMDKLSWWYESRNEIVQLGIYAGFIITFLLLLWLSITYIRFDSKAYVSPVPAHIGRASGEVPQDTTTKK
jgi:hypothetical protein